jgi:hypothetical protein
MSTYIPGVINERSFGQAQKDAMAAYAPKAVVMISGFLSGFVAAWLPGLIALPLLFLYRYSFGAKAWMTSSEKTADAVAQLVSNAQAYSRIAIPAAIALGLYGILQAILRQRSCLANRYFSMELSKYGEVRIGLDGQLTILGFPVLTVIYLWLSNRLAVLIVAIFLIVLSGFFYHLLWTKLDDVFLTLLHRPGFDNKVGMALRVMVPRHVGWSKCTISGVEVNRSEKSVRVEGHFESEIDEKEARNVIGHFLRGYHPIYLVNTKEAS